MQASDFRPGDYITDAQRLVEWLRFEEAVYVMPRPRDGQWDFLTCRQARQHRRDIPDVWPRWLTDGRIRQALRRVSPETAAAVAADVVTKEGTP